MFLKNNHYIIKKLSTTDIFSKYLLKNIFLVPKLSKVVIKTSIDEAISIIQENSIEIKNELSLKLKLYIIFFCFLLNDCYLKKIINIKENKNDLKTYNFILQSTIKNNNMLNFLLFFFIENNNDIQKSKNIFFKNKKNQNFNIKKKQMPFSLFSEINSTLNTSIFNLNLKNLKINLDFWFLQQKKTHNIENVPFFWTRS
jgi:hypothetical protein